MSGLDGELDGELGSLGAGKLAGWLALFVGNGISLLALCLYSTVISLLSLLIREKDSCSPVIRL